MIENNIIILCLPSHSSATLQPLDRGVLKEMKKDFRSLVARFFLKNNFNSIDKINFSKLMKDLFEEFYRKEHVLSGFKATCIFPLDPQVVLGNEKVLAVGKTFQNEKFNSAESQNKEELVEDILKRFEKNSDGRSKIFRIIFAKTLASKFSESCLGNSKDSVRF